MVLKKLLARPPKQNSTVVQDAMARSFLILRFVVGICAFCLPMAVTLLAGHLDPTKQTSVSYYYYEARARDVFVAVLCIIGVFLLSYNVYQKEVWIHSCMGVFALLVGMCPTHSEFQPFPGLFLKIWHIHVVSAVLLFVGMEVLAWFYFPYQYSLSRGLPDRVRHLEALVYRLCAGVIVLSTIGFLLRLCIVRTQSDSLYYLEFISIMSFGVAWLTKSHALF